jgi:hypothetical protein
MKKHIVRATKWLISVIIFVSIVEGGFRIMLTPRGFEKLNYELEQSNPISFIFVGTSRTSASINTEEWSRQFNNSKFKQGSTINVGQGAANMHYSFLGLKNAMKNHPGRFKGTTLMIEAPGQTLKPLDWSDSWTGRNPGLISQELENEDIAGLLNSNTEDKYWLCFEKYIPLQLYHKRGYIKNMIVFWRMENALESVFISENQKTETDLTVDGGIRTDKKGVKLVREQAIKELDSLNQTFSNWEYSVVDSLINLAVSNEMTVVFFQAAESPMYLESYKSIVNVENSKNFKLYLKDKGVKLILPDTLFPEKDFPDLLHISKSKSVSFTISLANSYKGDASAGK